LDEFKSFSEVSRPLRGELEAARRPNRTIRMLLRRDAHGARLDMMNTELAYLVAVRNSERSFLN
jgi:hypothetical protein